MNHLERFLQAQEGVYSTALAELRRGRKVTHWMWFIFPQIEGLGMSSISKLYSIKNLDEARNYLNHPILGKRLVECVEAVMGVEASLSEIFGYPDDLKFKSSMTLFEKAAGKGSIFSLALDKCCGGLRDEVTLKRVRLRYPGDFSSR